MLRPEFTQQLAARLLSGDSINMQGEHGTGRRQTLDDLISLLPDNVTLLKANLRSYPANLSLMADDLSEQAGVNRGRGFEALLDSVAGEASQTLIILHNFDELQFGEQSGYDATFMQLLNSIPARPNLSLLTVTVSLPEQWQLSITTLPLPELNP